MKAKASGTPPVLASTPHALATSRRNSRLGDPPSATVPTSPITPARAAEMAGELEARDVVVQVRLARVKDASDDVGERQAAGVVAERLDHHRGGGHDQEQRHKDEERGDADDGEQAS